MFTKPKFSHLIVLATLALFLGACESDSPTAPSQGPAPAVSASSSGTTNFSISLSASPDSFNLSDIIETGDSRSVITITARRADNNEVVPTGSTAMLSTTVGTLTSGNGAATGLSIPVSFQSGGTATAFLDLPVFEVTAVVRAQIQNSSSQINVTVRDVGETPLFIQSVSPSSGPPSGGTTVSIFGTGFVEPVRVMFGTLPANVLSATSSRLTVSTPQIDLAVGETSAVAVSVTTNVNGAVGTSATDILANAYTYARAGQIEQPRIISVTPQSGPNEGGTLVTISGEGFASEVQVFFGLSALIEANVISVAPTEVRAETPSATGPNAVHQNAIVDVRLVNTASGAGDTRAGAFQYGGGGSPSLFISAAGPSQGVYLGGTIAEIFGQGFDEPVAVEFGGFGQQEISVTGTEIVARSGPVEIIDCNRPSGPFRVVNIETNEAASSGIVFTYRPIEPVIGSLVPSSTTIDIDSRAILGPDTAVMSGFGFDRNSFVPRVTFGTSPDDVAASVLDVLTLDTTNFDPSFEIISSMRISIPSFFGTFNVESCQTPGGETGERLLPTRVNVSIDNLPTGCTDTLVNGFTYIPSDTSCVATDTGTGTALDATFTVSSNLGTEARVVTFVHTNSGAADTWAWSFIPDDGTVIDGGINQPFVKVDFPVGNHTVQLVVTATGQGDGQSQVQIAIPCTTTACPLP
jgi:hypothetical protein